MGDTNTLSMTRSLGASLDLTRRSQSLQSSTEMMVHEWLSYMESAVPSEAMYGASQWVTMVSSVVSYGDVFSGYIETLVRLGDRELSHPLRVFVEPDEDAFLAQTSEFEQVHGAGATIKEALDDFESSLLELYEDLSDPRVAYSTDWQVVRDRLNELMG